MIRFILLGFLQYQPMSGYDLKQVIDRSTSHFWHAYHSQIYTTLRSMEKEELITSEIIPGEGQLDRRVYTLTKDGQRELKNWLDQSMTTMSTVKDELLVRIFFSAQRDERQVLSELILQRELHQQKLAVYQLIEKDYDKSDPHYPPQLAREAIFWRATLRLGIRYETAYLDWLEETIHTIENLKKEQPEKNHLAQ